MIIIMVMMMIIIMIILMINITDGDFVTVYFIVFNCLLFGLDLFPGLSRFVSDFVFKEY